MLCVPPLPEFWGHVAQMYKLLSGPIHQEALTPQFLQPMHTCPARSHVDKCIPSYH